MGGRLPIPKNQAANKAFANASSGMKVWGSWLGVTDTKTEGTWLDDEGDPLTFENWRKGEPNDYGKGEDCAVIYDGGDWNDEPCTHDRRFACLFESQQRPSDQQLCTRLEDTLDSWTRTHVNGSKTSILAQSIHAQHRTPGQQRKCLPLEPLLN